MYPAKNKKKEQHMHTTQRDARIAGGLYLLAGGLGAFSELFVRANIYVPNNPFETSQIMMQAASLFRAGMLAELAMAVLYLFLALALFKLLKQVNRTHAVAMVVLVVCCVPVVCVSVVSQYAALHTLLDAEYLSVFSETQIQALSYLLFNIQKIGYLVAAVFFGLWLLPLGLLVFRSGFLPKVFGVLLISACGAYLLEIVLVIFKLKPLYFLFDFTMPVYAVAELGFIFWLLVLGVDVKRWSEKQKTSTATVTD